MLHAARTTTFCSRSRREISSTWRILSFKAGGKDDGRALRRDRIDEGMGGEVEEREGTQVSVFEVLLGGGGSDEKHAPLREGCDCGFRFLPSAAERRERRLAHAQGGPNQRLRPGRGGRLSHRQCQAGLGHVTPRE